MWKEPVFIFHHGVLLVVTLGLPYCAGCYHSGQPPLFPTSLLVLLPLLPLLRPSPPPHTTCATAQH